MAASGYELNLNLDFSKALQQAAQFEQKLKDLTTQATTLETALSKAGNALSGSNADVLNRIKSALEQIGNKTAINIDTSKVNELYTALDKVVQTINLLGQSGRGKEAVQIFDTKGIYATSEGVLTVEDRVKSINTQIEKVKQEWAGLNVEINKINNSQMLPHNKEKHIGVAERKKAKKEEELTALIEQKAIADKELQYANMTQDQKAEYLRKTLQKMLAEERKFANGVRKEYSTTTKELVSVLKQSEKLSKVNVGGVHDGKLQQLEARYIELNNKRIAMEQQYGNVVTDIARNTQRQIWDVEAKRIQDKAKAETQAQEEYNRTLRGAAQYSNKAQSITEERQAIEYLIAARDNLSKNTKNYEATIDALNKRIQKHRISVEELTTAEKNENSLQPKVRNEYARLLVELDKVREAKKRLEETSSYKSGNAKAMSAMDDLVARETDVQNRILQIRQNAQGKLDEVDRKHNAQRATESIAEFERAERRKDEIMRQGMQRRSKLGIVSTDSASRLIGVADNVKNVVQAERAMNAMREAIKHLDKDSANYQKTVDKLKNKIKELEQFTQSATRSTTQTVAMNANQAMAFSRSAKSIEEQNRAIKALKIARDNLNRGDFASDDAYKKRVEELTNEIKRQQAEVDKLTGKNGEMGKSHRSLMDTAGQLQRKLALLFSVSAIKGYVNKLIEVRGEFEMQQRSLQSLLGDVDAANKIWDKTVALAVKSPFTVRNLVTYTKQLAAYRIESNKLYETNKMLADVSAGLGVDMSRLILAFGQVKAATVLRGTELRQFTEAGVNMLSELATLYTELEGRMVSTADVFERISKKMVAFEDVEEVFKRLTSEGGLFYEMQEKQSETLIGMQRNLKDSVDLMINSIGQANDGVLKWGVSLVREMVENWRVMAYTIKMLIPAMAALGISKFIAGWRQVAIAGEAAALAMNGAAGAGARMNVALKNIGKTIKAHPILSLLSVAAALGLAIWDLYKAHSAENEQYNEANRAEVRKLNNLIELNEQTKDYNAQIKQSEETMKKMGKGSKEYAEAQTICNTAQRENEKIMAKIRSKYPELLEYIDQHKNGVVNLTEALEAQRAVTQLMVVINEAMKADTWITDGFREDIGDASKAQAKFKNEIVDTNVKATEAGVKIQELYAKLGDDNVNLTAFEKMFKDLEKAKTLEEVEKGVNEINKAISLLDASMTRGRLTSIMNAFNNQYTTLVDKNETYKSKLAELSTVIEEVAPSIERTLSNIYDTTTDEGKKSAGKMLTMILEQMGLVDKEMKEWAKTEVTKNFRINVIFEDKETEGTLDKWQQNVKDEIEKLNKKLSSQGYATITLPKASDTREQYQNYIKGLYDGNESVLKATKVIGQKIYDEDQKIEATVLKDIYKAAKKVVGLGDDKKDSGQSIWEKRISIIKELRKEYDDLNKTFDKNTSKQKILEGYADAANGVFKGLGISIGEIPFDDLGKLTEFVDKLMDKTAKGSNDYIKLGKLKGSLEVEIETDKVKEEQENRIKGLEEDFDKYELGLELEKLNLPKNFIKDFFDVDVLSLEDLRKKVENFDTTGFGEDALKDYQKLVDKMNEMDEKAQAERLKTYLQYARESVGERAKIELEELKKLQEIERTFKPLDTDTEEVKKQKQQAKPIAIKKVKDESEQATKKLEWEEFQKSDMFLMIFEDLESASGTLIESTLEKLKDFKKQWADMPLESVRAMTDKINQLESALLKLNNPFKAVGEIDKSIKGILGGQTREQINQEALESQQKIDQNNVEIGQLETIRELMLEGKTLTQEQRDIYTQTTGSIRENVETLNEEIEKRKGDNKELDKSVSRARQLTKAEKDKINAYNAQADAYNNINKMANDLYNASKELVELFAGDDSIGVVFADMSMSMANSVLNTLALQAQLEAAKVSAQGFGAAMNAAMGVIGWIVMAIQLVSQAVSAVIKAHDKGKQKEIDEEAEAVRRLEKAYKKLEKGIEDAYSLTTLKAANELAEQNLKMQRNHYREMQRLEEEKKNTDKEKIKDYQDSIDEIGEQIEQLQIDRVSEVTAGILDSAKDAARNFVDAWLDAFNETGDGLSGLKDSFKEITLDMVKQQASLLIAGTYLDRWKDMLSAYINKDDLELTSQEAAKWIDEVQQQLPLLNEQLEAYFRAMEQAGVDLDGTGEQLSGLQKGIQGITETQADIIAAYLNSIRFYVADSNVKLNQLLAMQTNEEIPNPMLSQLKIIASQTTAINTLLGSVTKSGHSAGGRGIKVFIS